MRAALYRSILSWPGVLLPNAIGVAAIFAGVFAGALKNWLGGMPVEQIYLWCAVMLCATLAYWVLRLALRPDAEDIPVSGGQSTLGQYSPAIGRIEGGAHFYGPMQQPSPPPAPQVEPPTLADFYKDARLTADMPFVAVLARVYRALGGAPDDREAKQQFYDRVDRELNKKVRQYSMRVWGFYGKRGPELLGNATLGRGWFDHRSKTFVVPGDALTPMRYEHLEFNCEQVDEVWPDERSEGPRNPTNPPGRRRLNRTVRVHRS